MEENRVSNHNNRRRQYSFALSPQTYKRNPYKKTYNRNVSNDSSKITDHQNCQNRNNKIWKTYIYIYIYLIVYNTYYQNKTKGYYSPKKIIN